MLSLLLTVAVVCLALWYRLQPNELPSLAEIQALRLYVADHFAVPHEIKVEFDNRGFRFPDLIKATQLQVNKYLKEEGMPYNYTLIDKLPKNIERTDGRNSGPGGLVPRAVDEVKPTDDASKLTIPYTPAKTGSPQPDFTMQLHLDGFSALYMDQTEFSCSLSYDIEAIHSNDLPFFLSQTIVEHLFGTDREQWHSRNQTSIADYIPQFQLNIVGVEDRETVSDDIRDAFESNFGNSFEPFSAFMNISLNFESIDISKGKFPANFLSNQTNLLTYLYLTTLHNVLNNIHGVHIHHLVEEVPQPVPEDVYGTELEEAKKRSENTALNLATFLFPIVGDCAEALNLDVSHRNGYLVAYFLNKLYTIRGMVDVLDRIIDLVKKSALTKEEAAIYKKICHLVDHTLATPNQDWQPIRDQVLDMYRSLEP